MPHSVALYAAPATAVALLLGCGDGRTPLVLYSPHGREILQPLEERYETLQPGIDVRWLDMGSQEVLDRLRSEAANPQADVWFGGPATIFSQGAEAGLLAAYRPTWAEAVPETSRHPRDLYFGVYRSTPILVHNTDAVREDEAPRDWDDLLEPRWRGKVVLRDPLASGTMRTIFCMILARSVAATGGTEAGFAWLRRLDEQTREYVFSPSLLFQKLIRQEGLVSMWELTDILLLRDKGSPLGYRFASSGTPVIDDSIGVVAGCRHPREAAAFVDWVGGVDALLLILHEAYRLPARLDLPAESLPQWARDALAQLEPAEIDWDIVERHAAEWMATWDREVRGRGAG